MVDINAVILNLSCLMRE